MKKYIADHRWLLYHTAQLAPERTCRQMERASTGHVKLPQIQGLRGIAILAIAVSHGEFLYAADGSKAFGWWGALGVELFILMSGFLSCYWHFGEAQPAFSIRSSSTRIRQKLGKYVPLHLVTLAIALPFAYQGLLAGKLSAWTALVMNASLLQTWIPRTSFYFSYNGVSWFLSLMVFLVIVTPRMIAWLQQQSVRAVIFMMAGVLAFEWAWTVLVMPASEGVRHWLAYVCPVVRSLDLILGGGHTSSING